MSKIHEALKRAQQERSPVLNDEPVPAFSAVPLVSNDSFPNSVRPEPIPSPGFDQRVAAPLNPPRPQTVRTRPSIEPVLSPQFEELLKRCAKPIWSPDPSALIFSAPHVKAVGAEQFRTLRSRLYSLRETANLKKILITSAIPAEGKTFVASNIAQAIAREKGRRVLLIDGDLRKPRLHIPFGAPLSPGLSNYLGKDMDEASVIQYNQEGNLCFIPGGAESAHASELLSNGRLQKLLDSVAPLFDWIIVDSPPCLPVADAGVLAGLCDAVLLVVRAKHTPSAMTQKARKELQKRNVVGVVLNAVDKQSAYESYQYYGYDNSHVEPASANDI